ncbi:MAG: ribonuclease III [Candidatus Absconditabacteria bacterium]
MLPQEVLDKKPVMLAYAKSIGIPIDKIQNEHLFLQVFVHKSFAADYKHIMDHNERLEFLGDGILGAVINKILFSKYPERDESDLTLYKIALVREENLANVGRNIHIDKYIFISKGEEKTQGRQKSAILADCVEALIGFLYVDIGIEAAEAFIIDYVYSQIDNINKDPVKSYKTMVQEVVQKTHKQLPVYQDIEDQKDEKGNVTQYRSELYVLDQKTGEGLGINKKKAQEEAAKSYYLSLTSE